MRQLRKMKRTDICVYLCAYMCLCMHVGVCTLAVAMGDHSKSWTLQKIRIMNRSATPSNVLNTAAKRNVELAHDPLDCLFFRQLKDTRSAFTSEVNTAQTLLIERPRGYKTKACRTGTGAKLEQR